MDRNQSWDHPGMSHTVRVHKSKIPYSCAHACISTGRKWAPNGKMHLAAKFNLVCALFRIVQWPTCKPVLNSTYALISQKHLTMREYVTWDIPWCKIKSPQIPDYQVSWDTWDIPWCPTLGRSWILEYYKYCSIHVIQTSRDIPNKVQFRLTIWSGWSVLYDSPASRSGH